METVIFEDYESFLSRKDKSINGVSPEFSRENPDWKKDNKTNEGCWDCYKCKYCRGCIYCNGCTSCLDCTDCYDCTYCNGCNGCTEFYKCCDCLLGYQCTDCTRCSYCWRCVECKYCTECKDCINCLACYRCLGCKKCTRCSRCYRYTESKNSDIPPVPVIPNIHKKILEATSHPGALDSLTCHRDGFYGTSHSRAGWVTNLAGEEGRKLEDATSVEFAALLIYNASCPDIPVSPVRFYEKNKDAIIDISRCADEEARII